MRSAYEPNLTSVRTPQRPVDDNHALRVGFVAGAVAKASGDEPLSGIKTWGIELVDDDEGHHLDAFRITAPSGTYLVSIEKES